MLFLFTKPNFSTVVKDYTRLVYYFARKMMFDQDQVDDIVSETFMKAFKAYQHATFKNSNSIKSWLLSICHNTIKNSYRNYKNDMRLFDDDVEQSSNIYSENDTFLETVIKEEMINEIKHKVSTLEPVEQQLIHLRIYEDLSFKEISTIFNTKEAAIKMRFYRTIQKLKEAIV